MTGEAAPAVQVPLFVCERVAGIVVQILFIIRFHSYDIGFVIQFID